MIHQFGWAGPETEEPALEMFASHPDQPIVDTRMIDWEGVATAMQSDTNPINKQYTF